MLIAGNWKMYKGPAETAEFCIELRRRAVNSTWIDMAVHLYSGRPVQPPSDDFIMRNSGDAEQFSVGWWPGDQRYGRAAFFAFAFPMPEHFSNAELGPRQAHWDSGLGEFVLDWEDIRSGARPARPGARVRPLGVPALLCGVRVGSGPGLERAGRSPASALAPGRGPPHADHHLVDPLERWRSDRERLGRLRRGAKGCEREREVAAPQLRRDVAGEVDDGSEHQLHDPQIL